MRRSAPCAGWAICLRAAVQPEVRSLRNRLLRWLLMPVLLLLALDGAIAYGLALK